jgi:hypothetical protein
VREHDQPTPSSENHFEQNVKRYTMAKLLIIDESGYVPSIAALRICSSSSSVAGTNARP